MQPESQSAPLFESRLRGLKKIHQGKVRDIYDVDAEHLLIVTTDRLSAFDVVLPDPIPFKGEVLTQISLFWFAKTQHIVANHLSRLRVEDVVSDAAERAQLAGRAMVVKKLSYSIPQGFLTPLSNGRSDGGGNSNATSWAG